MPFCAASSHPALAAPPTRNPTTGHTMSPEARSSRTRWATLPTRTLVPSFRMSSSWCSPATARVNRTRLVGRQPVETESDCCMRVLGLEKGEQTEISILPRAATSKRSSRHSRGGVDSCQVSSMKMSAQWHPWQSMRCCHGTDWTYHWKSSFHSGDSKSKTSDLHETTIWVDIGMFSPSRF